MGDPSGIIFFGSTTNYFNITQLIINDICIALQVKANKNVMTPNPFVFVRSNPSPEIVVTSAANENGLPSSTNKKVSPFPFNQFVTIDAAKYKVLFVSAFDFGELAS